MLTSYPGPSLQHYRARAKQCTGGHFYSTTHSNKTVNVDKIKHLFILLVLPTKSVFIHKRHAVDRLHRLEWGPYACGALGQLPSVPMRKDDTGHTHAMFHALPL
jgi:hypothetical protein